MTDTSSDLRGDGQPGNGPSQVRIVIPADQPMVSLLGSRDEMLRVIEREFAADIHVRGNEITVTGRPAETALVSALFEELIELLANGAELSADAVERAAAMLRRERGVRPAEVLTLDILSARGRTIRPKTLNQKRYVDAIDKHTIVFSIGPAGTGKTYLAMAKAVKALQAKEVNRIILTRPAVEAGERLGFLPGTLYEKIDPYLRPLYDALHDMLDPDSIPRLTAAGTIEVAPLAYMRGRAQPLTRWCLPRTVSGPSVRWPSATWLPGRTASRRQCSVCTRKGRRTSSGSPRRTAPRPCARVIISGRWPPGPIAAAASRSAS